MNLAQNISLKNYNSFGIEVYANYFSGFSTVLQLQEALDYYVNFKAGNASSILILGGGSNILFTKNYEGLVLKNELEGIEVVQEDDNFIYVKAGAGVGWHQFVLYCIQNNFAGVENLIADILTAVKKLAASFKLGNIIKNGVATVIAGRPNAGKSTLLNALLNEERAIVTDIAGTTRDTIEEKLIVNGIVFRLIDTAGIREATDSIEKIGIEKSMEKINNAVILMYVFDASTQAVIEVKNDIEKLNPIGQKILLVANKTDMCTESKLKELHRGICENIKIDFTYLEVSALKKQHIETLVNSLHQSACKWSICWLRLTGKFPLHSGTPFGLQWG
jgi:small GTP-binding protein